MFCLFMYLSFASMFVAPQLICLHCDLSIPLTALAYSPARHGGNLKFIFSVQYQRTKYTRRVAQDPFPLQFPPPLSPLTASSSPAYVLPPPLSLSPIVAQFDHHHHRKPARPLLPQAASLSLPPSDVSCWRGTRHATRLAYKFPTSSFLLFPQPAPSPPSNLSFHKVNKQHVVRFIMSYNGYGQPPYGRTSSSPPATPLHASINHHANQNYDL